MSRFSGNVEGPRWAHIGEALEVFAMHNEIDIQTITTKYIIRERIDFTVNGTAEEFELIRRWLTESKQEYNK